MGCPGFLGWSPRDLVNQRGKKRVLLAKSDPFFTKGFDVVLWWLIPPSRTRTICGCFFWRDLMNIRHSPPRASSPAKPRSLTLLAVLLCFSSFRSGSFHLVSFQSCSTLVAQDFTMPELFLQVLLVVDTRGAVHVQRHRHPSRSSYQGLCMLRSEFHSSTPGKVPRILEQSVVCFFPSTVFDSSPR